MHTITTLDINGVRALWPVIGNMLLAGASVDASVDLASEVRNVLEERARVWVIASEDRIVAAFLTSIVTDGDGRALDCYGLGGAGMARWGRELTDAMVAYARLAECGRVIFKGRKALKRTYPGIRVVGIDGDHFIYERRVA